MDLSKLQKALETAPSRLKTLTEEIAVRTDEKGSIAFFLDAVRILRTCWRESDPGKYGLYLSCYKDGKKAWPRELVDTAAVAKHVAEHRKRMPHWKDYDVMLAPISELRQEECPDCRTQVLLVCSVQQTYDSPGGDEWAKVHYVLCAHCVGLFQLGDFQVSTSRF